MKIVTDAVMFATGCCGVVFLAIGIRAYLAERREARPARQASRFESDREWLGRLRALQARARRKMLARIALMCLIAIATSAFIAMAPTMFGGVR